MLFRVSITSLLLSLILVSLFCFIPIRWDVKTLRSVLPSLNKTESKTDIILITPDNGYEYGFLAKYGFDFILFPNHKAKWIVFREGYSGFHYQPDMVIDRTGKIYWNKNGRFNLLHKDALLDLSDFSKDSLILVPSLEMKEMTILRWPDISLNSIKIIKEQKLSFFESPRLRINTLQLFRIFLVSFVLTALFYLFSRARHLFLGHHEIIIAFAFPLGIAIHTSIVFLSGKYFDESLMYSLIVEASILSALMIYISKKNFVKEEQTAIHATSSWTILVGFVRKHIVIFIASFCFVILSILQLDFDGDMFTHWLPMARAHYLYGFHNIDLLYDRYGGAHHATYPPGFPIIISSLMWIGLMAKDASFSLGQDSNLVVFLYRFFFTALHLIFLYVLALIFKRIGGRKNSWECLLPVVMIVFILPLFLGRPMSSEIYFVPMNGFSILALFAGGTLKNKFLTRTGLFLGASTLFLKNDALLIFPFLVMPWYILGLEKSYSLRRLIVDLSVFVLGLIPFVVWKIDFLSLGIDGNFMFRDADMLSIFVEYALLIKLAENAAKLMLSSNFWVVIFIFLPAAATYSWILRRNLKDIVIPVGIILYFMGITLMYLFSMSDPIHHMNTSFLRLMMVALISASIYVCRTLLVIDLRQDINSD